MNKGIKAIVQCVKYYRKNVLVCVHQFRTFKILKFMFYSADSLRQKVLVNDKSVTVLPCKQNNGGSNKIEHNQYRVIPNTLTQWYILLPRLGIERIEYGAIHIML